MTSDEQLLDQYDRNLVKYKDFTKAVSELLIKILATKDVRFHTIESRVKERVSLSEKIRRSDSNYNTLSDITDISGIRIITFLADEVAAIAEIVKCEFDIDLENSIDKIELLDPDRFGYLSLHYVVSFSDKRLDLPEYNQFKGFKAEIQIRSILQHAWAEIFHDLGYKSKTEIPRDVQREFARLAGLMELGDSEFERILDKIKLYKTQLPKLIAHQPESVTIDRTSLEEFVKSNPLVRGIDQEISKTRGVNIVEDTSLYGRRAKQLNYLSITTIAMLKDELENNRNAILNLEESVFVWLEINSLRRIRLGISLYLLCLVEIASTSDEQFILNYLNEMDILLPSKRPKFAKFLVDWYGKFSKNSTVT